jgi:hypothetical protein
LNRSRNFFVVAAETFNVDDQPVVPDGHWA